MDGLDYNGLATDSCLASSRSNTIRAEGVGIEIGMAVGTERSEV